MAKAIKKQTIDAEGNIIDIETPVEQISEVADVKIEAPKNKLKNQNSTYSN